MTAWTPEATAAGIAWDAVRIPLDTGTALYERLTATPETRQLLGPVIASPRSDVTYWLIAPGSTGSWPAPCRLLSHGSALLLPAPGIDVSSAHWLHHPEPWHLTGVAWLATALHHHLYISLPEATR